MSEQRYVINGINNDKIEFKTNYDIRKFNRLRESNRAEIISLAKFHGQDIPIVYGDGTESVDKMVSITELGYILDMVLGNHN